MAARFRATIIGTASLANDLDAVSDGLGQTVAAAIVEAAEPIAKTARLFAPRGPGPQSPKDDLPHLADTLFMTPYGAGAALRSPHPAAGVIEYGGTIAPRGTQIQIREHAYARRALDAERQNVADRVDHALDRLIRQHFPGTP